MSEIKFQGEFNSLEKQGSLEEQRFVFKGSAGEYFNIWLVNLALNILTLGLHAPWAKVRREQYMLGNTYLGDSSFQYEADPWKIFKGRLIIFGFAVIISIVNHISPLAFLLITPILLIAIPWIITSALRFRARYTSFRNIKFRFKGGYGQTGYNFLVLPVLGAIPLGILVPWAKCKQRKYIVDNLQFGKENFQFNSPVRKFYTAYLTSFLIMLVPMSLFIFNSLSHVYYKQNAIMPGAIEVTFRYVAIFLFMAAFFLVPMVLKTMLAIATWNGVKIGQFQLKSSISTAKYIWILISNFFLRIITLGLATPYCAIRARKYLLNNLFLVGAASLDGFIADKTEEIRALGDEASDLYDVDQDFGF